jgi:hypothetical protein
MQLLHETNIMRKRAYLLPKDHMVHTVHPSMRGEHEFYFYNEQPEDPEELRTLHSKPVAADAQNFYSTGTRQIKDYWTIPLFQECLGTGLNQDQFRLDNRLQALFQPNAGYDVGDVNGKMRD